MATGVIIAAPSSASGKTTVTLALLSALRQRGVKVSSAKVGPDYLDPRFHSIATSSPCYNLDMWAMRPGTLASHFDRLSKDSDLIVVEGVMGLFDGPETGKGSTADVARNFGLPVILVVNCGHHAQSVAALIHGFATFDRKVNIAGIILNQVSSERHTTLLTKAAATTGIPVLGVVPRTTGLQLPSRHLGLVQAEEIANIQEFIDKAGKFAADTCDLDAVVDVSRPIAAASEPSSPLPPLGQRISIARDEAFGFLYPHYASNWRDAGAELHFFSPLANETPATDADAVFLPGGYPELHADRISAAGTFLEGLRTSKALIYGECGGYMVLGDGLITRDGVSHQMAGLLPVTTSFADRSLTLGYRTLHHNSPLPWPTTLKGHEFHFSTVSTFGDAQALFSATDTNGSPVDPMGARIGNVMGSYAHIIDGADT